MALCGTKNGSSVASLWRTFEAPLFLRVQDFFLLPVINDDFKQNE